MDETPVHRCWNVLHEFTMRARKTIFLGVVFCCLASLSLAQNSDDKKRTYFENITIDSEGHVCYFEPFSTNGLNRIEYKTNGKSELDIFFESESARINIRLTDFNNDDKVDLIYVMKENIIAKIIRKVDFYRGPEYLEHLKRHYKHALLTATHPLIKHRPDEVQRAKEIENELERLNTQHIEPAEMGAYRQDMQFMESKVKELAGAFVASDTLNSAVRTVLEGDFRVLSQRPEITTKYYMEISTLLGIDPSSKIFGRK